ncbi:MAG: glycosyltransferase family 2 protein [Clostridiales bacterium]|nr:glycosyltransferase family 2 protein [Clostridiales bacterium]
MSVSAIIPAYNEEDRISGVIKVLLEVKEIDEILAVDDGSEDNTSYAAKMAGAQALTLERNRGKAYAMLMGAQKAKNDTLLFIDADLLELEKRHVRGLILPILLDEADMTVGIFSSGRAFTDLAQLVAPNLSGQRALTKEYFFRAAADMEDLGYGIESQINHYAKKNDWRVANVEFDGVSQVMKEEKLGLSKGVAARMKMYMNIVKTVGNRQKTAIKKGWYSIKDGLSFVGDNESKK